MITIALTNPPVRSEVARSVGIPCGAYNLSQDQEGYLSQSCLVSLWVGPEHIGAELTAAGGILSKAISANQIPVDTVQLPTEYLHAAYGIGLPAGSPLILPAPPSSEWLAANVSAMGFVPVTNLLGWILTNAPQTSQYAGTATVQAG